MESQIAPKLIEDLKSKLQLALGQEIAYPDSEYKVYIERRFKVMKPAAVLILFGFEQEEVQLLYIKRTEHLDNHKGQIAFPGGFCEPKDQRNPIETALRETTEEVGIDRNLVEVVGQLPAYPTTTGFLIQPVLGILRSPIHQTPLILDEFETHEAFWAPLNQIRRPDVYKKEPFQYQGNSVFIHVFQIDRHRIWGATAAITKNFLDRMASLS